MAQHLVARRMAVLVVHALEEVQVQNGQRERAALAPRPRHLVQKALFILAPVGQAGERVGGRLDLQRLLQHGALRGLVAQPGIAAACGHEQGVLLALQHVHAPGAHVAHAQGQHQHQPQAHEFLGRPVRARQHGRGEQGAEHRHPQRLAQAVGHEHEQHDDEHQGRGVDPEGDVGPQHVQQHEAGKAHAFEHRRPEAARGQPGLARHGAHEQQHAGDHGHAHGQQDLEARRPAQRQEVRDREQQQEQRPGAQRPLQLARDELLAVARIAGLGLRVGELRAPAAQAPARVLRELRGAFGVVVQAQQGGEAFSGHGGCVVGVRRAPAPCRGCGLFHCARAPAPDHGPTRPVWTARHRRGPGARQSQAL